MRRGEEGRGGEGRGEEERGRGGEGREREGSESSDTILVTHAYTPSLVVLPALCGES